ncbi:MAG: LPS export ABC transporter periplasmic protein LptC [Treponema sp.]|nr:LPS export ABC transporter periplasmic protein LptC [Treponema sp.]
MKNTILTAKLPALCSLLALFILLAGCTFDYGEDISSGDSIPDLVMDNVEYVRVRSSDPIARFSAERAERYENLNLMKLINFTFEQYGEDGEEVNAYGSAGRASVDIETSNIIMDNGIRVEVESEDIIIVTEQLEWKDEERLLYTKEDSKVNILQNNGTNFIGIGLRADARKRTWAFYGEVSGTYIYDDE